MSSIKIFEEICQTLFRKKQSLVNLCFNWVSAKVPVRICPLFIPYWPESLLVYLFLWRVLPQHTNNRDFDIP